jgi:hypothetical protein
MIVDEEDNLPEVEGHSFGGSFAGACVEMPTIRALPSFFNRA